MSAYFNYFCDLDELCFVDSGFTGPSGMKLYQREPTASGYLSEFYGAPEGASGEGIIFRLRRFQEGPTNYYSWQYFYQFEPEVPVAYSSNKDGGTGDFFSACPITTNVNPQDGFTFYRAGGDNPYDITITWESCGSSVTPTPTPTPTPTATPTPTITPTPTSTPTPTPTPTSDPSLKKAAYLELQNRGESPYYKVDTTLESVCSTFLKQYQNLGGLTDCFWIDSNGINNGAYVYSRDPSNGDCSQVRSKAYPMPDGYYRMVGFEGDYSYGNLIIRVRNSRIIEKFEGPCYKKIKPHRLFWKNTKDIILTRDKNGVLSNFKMQEGNSLAETNLIDMDAGLEYIDPVTKLRIVAPVKPKIKLVKRTLANGNINTNIISDSDASNSMELNLDPALTAMASGYGEIINRNLYPNISNDLNRSVTNRYVLTFDGDDDFDPSKSTSDKIVRVIDSEYLFTLPRCTRIARDVLQYELRLPSMLNMEGVWKPADNSIIATNNKLYYDRVATSSYDLTDYSLQDRKFIKVLLPSSSRSKLIRVQCDPCYLGINTQLDSQVLNLKFCLKNSTVEIPVTITIAKN